ncbi:MAG: SusC/RagA family TonB-linked outer membrane protein, partial [Chitinophagaceae bacterium]
MKNLLTFLLAFASMVQFTLAQTVKVQGTVQDSQGKGIPNVTISINGQRGGTTSDKDGNFTLNVNSLQSRLLFSSIGYNNEEVALNGKSSVTVTLTNSESNLGEVVVVGYGTQRKRDLTGSISNVSANQIKNLSLTSPEQALQGRVAGVNVVTSSGTPGSSVNINVRGIGTISGNAQPLYVLDGIPIATGSFSQLGVGNQVLNSLADVNPNDIESIDILKDASATAIYGSRGANGVVLITTKRGKNQKTRVNYSGYSGNQTVWRKIEPLSGRDFQDILQESLFNRYGSVYGNQEPSFYFGSTVHDNGYTNTNWQNEIFRTAPINSHDISAQGGNDKTKFYAGGSYFDQQGTIIGSRFQRYNFRVNVDNTVSEKFK